MNRNGSSSSCTEFWYALSIPFKVSVHNYPICVLYLNLPVLYVCMLCTSALKPAILDNIVLTHAHTHMYTNNQMYMYTIDTYIYTCLDLHFAAA